MSNDHHSSGRRVFLRTTLAAGLSLAAVILANKGVTAFAVNPEEDTQLQANQQGYHVTQHIADYYKSASL